MSFDVIGIENPVMDCLMLTEKMPQTDELVEIKESSWQGGGNIGTAIITLARLGAKCGIAGVVGNDTFGEFCIEDYNRHGVDISHIVREPGGKTTVCFSVAEEKTKGRSFFVKWGIRRPLTDEELDFKYITSAKYIHLAWMNSTEIKAAKWAKKNGIKVSIDAGYYYPEVEKYLDLIDVFIASEQYYKGLFKNGDYEKNCRKLQSRGPQIVIITLGSKGCIGLDGDNYFEVPAFKNIDIVDTTGAGDVFHGAYLFGLIRGWDNIKTAKFACAVSAITCTRLGGRAGIPQVETALRFLEDGYIDYTDINKRSKFYEDGIFNYK